MRDEAAGQNMATINPNGPMVERDDVTVRDNIDAKIARHQAAIAELEATKKEMGALLDMRIDRLRSAMNGGRY